MGIPVGSLVWRSYSHKRFAVDGVFRAFCNRHDYLAPESYTKAEAANRLNLQTVAEQHLLHNQNYMVLRTGLPLFPGNNPGRNLQCYAEFNTVRGSSSGNQVAPAVPWPVMLIVRKNGVNGEAGRYMFVGGVRTIDVFTGGDGRVYLKGGNIVYQLQMSGFNSFMKQGPFPPVIAPSYPGQFLPNDATLVKNFGGMEVRRLTSIPDAQQRKTLIAMSYKNMCGEFTVPLNVMGLEWKRLAYSVGINVPKIWIQQWQVLLGNVISAWQSVAQYYENGLSPSLAPEWRPTAGLDPFKDEARLISDSITDVMGKFGEEVIQMLQTPGTSVPREQLQGLEHRTWQIATMYSLFAERERFTGVPIPHPN